MTSPTPNLVEIIVRSKDLTGPGFDSAKKRAEAVGQSIDGGPNSAGAAIVRAERKQQTLNSTLAKMGAIAGGILAADILRETAQRVMALAQQTIHAASSLGESLNAVDKTFGTNAEAVHKWAESNAANFGLSQRAFNESATPLGAMLKNQGLTMDQVAEQTIKLTKRAADMASVFNVDVGSALVAIQAGLRGEADPLERFGVGLQATAVDARALADSGKTTTSMLTQQERAMARLNLIYDQTSTTAGDFADTATGLANAQRISTAEIENAQAKIGVTFLPVMAAAAKASGTFAETIGSVPGPVAAVAAGVAIAAAGLLVFAPRILATKAALDQMAISESAVTRGVGRFSTVVGKAGAALALMQITAAVVGGALDNELTPNVEAATTGLEAYIKTSALAGEASKVFGTDLGELSKGLSLPEKSGFDKFMDNLGGALGGIEAEVGHGTTAVETFDKVLAQMVREGKGELAFQALNAAAAKAGISVEEAKKKLPEFAAAVEVAGTAVNSMGQEVESTQTKLDKFRDSTDKAIKSAFGMDKASDAAAQGIADLAEQLERQKKAGDEGAGSLTGNTQAARDNRESVRGLVDDYQRLINEAYDAGKSTDGFAGQLQDQLVAMGFSREEAARYTAQIAELGLKLQSLPAVTTADVIVRLQTQETDRETKRLTRGFEHGGIVGAMGGGPRSGRTVVGEHGIEVIDIAPGSTVHSNEDSMRMMGAGQAGGVSAAAAPVQRIEIGSDGSRLGDLLIGVLAEAIRAKGGDLSLLNLKLPNSVARV